MQAKGLLFFGTDCTIVEFVTIVAGLEQALHCVFYTDKATSVQVYAGLGYINF